MKYDTATPYVAAYLLVEQQGKYLFVKRANTGWRDGFYGLPSGKVEKNENLLATAVREVNEEVGLTVNATDLRHAMTVHRRSEDGLEWIDVYFSSKSWQGEAYNAEPAKSSEIAWFSPDNLPENIIPSTNFALKQIAAGEHYCEYGWDKL